MLSGLELVENEEIPFGVHCFRMKCQGLKVLGLRMSRGSYPALPDERCMSL